MENEARIVITAQDLASNTLREATKSAGGLNDALADVNQNLALSASLASNVAVEFDAFQSTVKRVNEVLKLLGINLSTPWITAIYAVGLAMSKLDEYINKVQEAGSISGQKIYKNAQGGLEAKTGRFEYGTNDIFAAAIFPPYVALKSFDIISGRRILTKEEQTETALLGVYGEGPAGLGAKPAQIAKVDRSVDQIQAAIPDFVVNTSSSENKVAAATEKIRSMISQLNEKIQAETTGVYDANIKRLQDEIAKNNKDLNQAAKDGAAGVDEATAKLEEYNTAMKNKFAKEQKQAMAIFLADNKKYLAELVGDKQAAARAEYEVAIENLNKEREAKFKAIAESSKDNKALAAVEEWYATQKALASKKVIDANNFVRDSWRNLVIEQRKAAAELTGNAIAMADAEYQAAVWGAQKDRDERRKQIGQGGSDQNALQEAENEYDAKIKLAAQKRMQASNDNVLKELEIERQHYDQLYLLGQKSYSEVASLKKENLQITIDELRAEYSMYEEYEKAKIPIIGAAAQKRLEIEQKLNEAIRQQREMDGRNLPTAAGEAVRRIQEQTVDYAGIMVESWNSVNGSIQNNFTNLLTGAQNFSQSFKNIWKDLSNSIITMMAKVMYQQYIMKPIQNWWTNILNSWMGGGVGSDGKDSMPARDPYIGKKATGGPVIAGKAYLVGEEGMEVFVPGVTGTIIPNNRLKEIGGGQAAPKVTVQVINQSSQQIEPVQQTSRWNGDEYVIGVMIDAVARNRSGMRDLVAAAARG